MARMRVGMGLQPKPAPDDTPDRPPPEPPEAPAGTSEGPR
jgi:hypothetical protein